MDYKNLVERLNAYSAEYQRHGGITAEAADAIEALLKERDAAQKEAQDLQIQWDMYGGDEGVTAAFQKAEERDAAVDGLRGRCAHCTHFSACASEFPCAHCKITGGTTDYWQWRGPQKESGT